MCRWYCTSSGPSTNLACVNCGSRYCGACLHGEAGKMKSLVKCAKCGKKPTVKANADRAPWTNVVNPPCNEGGCPRYDFDDGAANSAFTSGHRETGAHQNTPTAQKRPASGSQRRGSKALVGPERFYYDKSTYTGTHVNGGPEHVAKGTGSATNQSWKRPDDLTLGKSVLVHAMQQMSAGTEARDAGPTLLGSRTPRHTKASVTGGSKDPQHTQERSASRGITSSRPSSGSGRTSFRPTSRSAAAKQVVGPERFFYDKSSYTGTHANGGPSPVSKGGGTSVDQSWKRRD